MVERNRHLLRFLQIYRQLSPVISVRGAVDFKPPLPPLPPLVTMIGGVPAKMEPESKEITIFNKAQIGLLLIL